MSATRRAQSCPPCGSPHSALLRARIGSTSWVLTATILRSPRSSRSEVCMRYAPKITVSSPRKRGPMVPQAGASGIWVPACAGTTDHSWPSRHLGDRQRSRRAGLQAGELLARRHREVVDGVRRHQRIGGGRRRRAVVDPDVGGLGARGDADLVGLRAERRRRLRRAGERKGGVGAEAGGGAHHALRMTANICPPILAPEAPDGVNEITSSSFTSRAAAGNALKSWPAAAPATVTVIAPPVIAVPLMAVAMAASAVVIVPCVTQPTLSTRPRNGART